MINNLSADLSAMLADFGADAVVGGVSVTGIFESPAAVAAGFGGERPSLLVKASDVPAVARGTVVNVGSDVFRVVDVTPDDFGGILTLSLEQS